ncbi:MAG: flavodoxin family protein [Spirochaetaceae bacterium]|nr:flavodoxin family protein [Spirochaetaceae bacterium]
MKVIALNGSPRENGNTFFALSKMAEELIKEGIETEIIQVGSRKIRGCMGCGHCLQSENNYCAMTDDILNKTVDIVREADGLILGSPTYYSGISGTMKSFLDRLFYTSFRKYFKQKVGASVSIARRAGAVDVIHQLNNYFNLAEMIIAPSQYWTIVFGAAQGEIAKDDEGIQTIQRNAQAMAWLLKIIDATRNTIPFPVHDGRARTNFIR